MVPKFEKGELRQAALWFITDEHQKKAQAYLQSVFDSDTQEYGVLWGPIRFTVKIPDFPPEPGAKLLIAESVVWGLKPPGLNFLLDLDSKDLHLLRDITQRAYQKLNPGKSLPIDRLDQMVAMIGHELAEKLLRENYEHVH